MRCGRTRFSSTGFYLKVTMTHLAGTYEISYSEACPPITCISSPHGFAAGSPHRRGTSPYPDWRIYPLMAAPPFPVRHDVFSMLSNRVAFLDFLLMLSSLLLAFGFGYETPRSEASSRSLVS